MHLRLGAIIACKQRNCHPLILIFVFEAISSIEYPLVVMDSKPRNRYHIDQGCVRLVVEAVQPPQILTVLGIVAPIAKIRRIPSMNERLPSA